MIKFVKDLFTERDNQTWDLNRLMFAVGVFSFLGMAIYSIAFNKQVFNWLDAGGGMGAVLGAGAGGLALNRKNQNGADPAVT